MPIGCLSMIVICSGVTTLMIIGAYRAVKNMSPYKEAVQIARAHPEVRDRLGTPIESQVLGEDAKFLDGEPDAEGGKTRFAEFDIPVSGPKGTGFIHVEANFRLSKWFFTSLKFLQPDKPPLDLLDGLEMEGINIDKQQE